MDVILVNIPIDSRKKPYDEAFPFSKSINFGILAIANFLVHNQYQASIFDPQTSCDNNSLDELLKFIQKERPTTVGLSCISGFGYTSFKRFARAIKKEFPEILIVAGGQNHIGILGKTVLEDCEAVDIVVKGEGERVMENLLQNIKAGASFKSVPNLVYRDSSGLIETPFESSKILNIVPKLDITLYPNFRMFPPIIEVSRGCPYSCVFCSSGQRNVRKKSGVDIISEAEAIVSAYKSEIISIYFEAPVLTMTDIEIAELIQLRITHRLRFNWRAGTRVEYMTPKRIRALFDSGMRVADVGLESGSSKMLKMMNKTTRCSNYLNTLTSALPICRQLGFIMKLNLLFYIGENADTLRETFDLLKQNAIDVQALSAYPLLLYPGSPLSNDLTSISKCKGSVIKTPQWVNRHLLPVNPSPDFTYEELHKIGIIMGKSFQTIENFYLQKSQGYYTPGTTYQEFERLAESYNIRHLPFSRNEREMIQARDKLSQILEGKKREYH